MFNCPCTHFRFRSAREAELSEKKARDKGEELPEVKSNKMIFSSNYSYPLLVGWWLVQVSTQTSTSLNFRGSAIVVRDKKLSLGHCPTQFSLDVMQVKDWLSKEGCK